MVRVQWLVHFMVGVFYGLCGVASVCGGERVRLFILLAKQGGVMAAATAFLTR